MNILLMLSHSIEEYMQVKLLSELGYNVFSMGAYINPSNPGDNKRPALPSVPYLKELADTVVGIDNPNDNPPQQVLDWADVIICHHFEQRWLVKNWSKLRDKRVIWRTVGQSIHENELRMKPLRDDGLQIIRYSPNEQNIPNYAGHDAIIRFWMDENEFSGWTGDEIYVGNITQDMKARGQWTGYDWWMHATSGLPVKPAGPGSQEIGGIGELPYEDMKAYLRNIRAYLYTGTFPASYTLGFLEAMMTGVPVVAAGPERLKVDFGFFPYGHMLYEGHQIAPLSANGPIEAIVLLDRLLCDRPFAEYISSQSRSTAIELFGKEKIAKEWKEFLG